MKKRSILKCIHYSYFLRPNKKVITRKLMPYTLVPLVYLLHQFYPLQRYNVWNSRYSGFEVEFMKTLLCQKQDFEYEPTFANQLTFLATTFRNISPSKSKQNKIFLLEQAIPASAPRHKNDSLTSCTGSCNKYEVFVKEAFVGKANSRRPFLCSLLGGW